MDTQRRTRVVALLFATFCVGWAAVISRDPSALSSEMWPAGLAAAAVFTAHRREVPYVVAAVGLLAFATFVLGGRPAALAVSGGVGVALEAWVIGLVLSHGWRIRPRLLDDEEDTSRLIGGVAAGAAVAALVTAVGLWGADADELGLVLLGTFVGHASSSLFLLPFFLRTDSHSAVAGRVERAAQWALVTGLTVLVFLPEHLPALLFLVLPILAWGARRLPLADVWWQLQVVAVIGTTLTVFGRGPLAEVPDAYALPEITAGILLQTFLLCCALVSVPVAVVVGHQLRDSRQLRLERDRAQRIVDSASVAIISTDEIGRVTSFNPGAERLLGYAAQEVMGEFTTLFHSEEAVADKADELGVRDEFAVVALRLAQPDCAASEVRFRRKDGVERTHLMTLSQIVDDRGQVSGYVSTSEDVTEDLERRAALEEALTAERRAVARLTEVDRVKDTFVSSVSHELRTPITSIVGYLEMLLDGTLGELERAQLDAVGRVNRNSRRLLSLIDELLTLARLQEDGLREAPAELDLRYVVRTAHDVVAPAWADRRLTVELRLPDEPVPCAGDEDMLERVVVNLLGNAVKFTGDGGRIRLCLALVGDAAVIEVTDDGIGIPEDEQELLFTRFFRSSTAQLRAIPGSGLGLAIAKTVVELHDGTIDVSSRPGEGATFRVRLPRHARAPVAG